MIALHTPDTTSYPNFALAKIAQYHRSLGDTVVQFLDIETPLYDRVYSSSVFTWSDKSERWAEWICGGTGYDIKSELPPEIESVEPDYSLYPDYPHAFGFLTRGCIRHCSFCIVHDKEGSIRPYRDIDTILQGRKTAVLMDNNVLACEHGLKQIERIIDLKVKVDFNQGMDVRLITPEIACLLSRVKWLSPIRLACDSDEMIPVIEKAVEWLRWYNCKPRVFSCYVLADDFNSTMRRLRFLKKLNVDPFVQPLVTMNNEPPDRKIAELARWANVREMFWTQSFEDFCQYRNKDF